MIAGQTARDNIDRSACWRLGVAFGVHARVSHSLQKSCFRVFAMFSVEKTHFRDFTTSYEIVGSAIYVGPFAWR